MPFVAGHLHASVDWRFCAAPGGTALKLVDQGSILLVVFTAFSAAVVEGLWRQLPASALLGLVVVCAVLLTLALVTTTWVARLGFSKEDEITLVFCGSYGHFLAANSSLVLLNAYSVPAR